ncbi:hypothetical protein EZV62_008506 [Acer yangbiense]|uniref:Uncharacterized protein n=1 Tax=Acer yangbiense TaxID=1000413 RepID=A0A5C7IDG6_9ROSI|nr:hypothetical protein EZV62_008506 [Acer yangbiense]
MTPEEAWSGRKPAVDHFKIFGCVAYAHIPDEKRKKLDNKGEKCVFLGVSEHSKAYKLFNPSTNKIVTSRDVIFDEENTWNWIENGSTQQQQHIPVNFDEDGDDKKDGQSYQQYDQQPLQQEQQHLQPSISRENQLAEATEVSSSRSQRSKRRPAWMMDYEVRGVVQPDDNDDTIAHFGDGKKILIVCLYVDDLIYTGSDKDMFDVFKKSMMTEFDMSDLGLMHYYLGIEVNQSSAGIFISQKKYVQEVLNRFQMKNCNPVTTPTEMGLKLVKNPEGEKVDNTGYKQIVGSLMYLTATRPDLMYAVSLISRYMESPREIHLLAAKRILRYMQGTIDYGLFYKKGEKSSLFGFTDSDYAGNQDDQKSTSGYVFMMGSGAVSWSSKKQQIVTLSTTKAEFVAATSCSCQAIWLRRLLEALHYRQQGPTLIYCDNVSAIKLSRNPVLHGRSKHIDVRYHFLRDLCKDGTIDLIFCRSEDQVADILTKPLKLPVFVKHSVEVCSSAFRLSRNTLVVEKVCQLWNQLVPKLLPLLVDEETSQRTRLDKGRILILVRHEELVSTNVRVDVGKGSFTVKAVEEATQNFSGEEDDRGTEGVQLGSRWQDRGVGREDPEVTRGEDRCQARERKADDRRKKVPDTSSLDKSEFEFSFPKFHRKNNQGKGKEEWVPKKRKTVQRKAFGKVWIDEEKGQRCRGVVSDSTSTSVEEGLSLKNRKGGGGGGGGGGECSRQVVLKEGWEAEGNGLARDHSQAQHNISFSRSQSLDRPLKEFLRKVELGVGLGANDNSIGLQKDISRS